jgi:hypothetical protein
VRGRGILEKGVGGNYLHGRAALRIPSKNYRVSYIIVICGCFSLSTGSLYGKGNR